jgi:hypothetical protein
MMLFDQQPAEMKAFLAASAGMIPSSRNDTNVINLFLEHAPRNMTY